MKKKLLTLVALLTTVVSGAWANNSTLIDGFTLPDLPTTKLDLATQTTFTTDDCVDANGNIIVAPIYWNYGSSVSSECPMKDATWFTANSFSSSGDTWTAPTGSVFRGSNGWNSSYRRRLNVRKTERTYAVRFKGCEGISLLGSPNGQTLYLSVYNISGGNIGSLVQTASLTGSDEDKVLTVNSLTSSNEYVAYIYCSANSNAYLYEIAFLAPSSLPVINAANTSITATTSGVEVTKDIAVTGNNLTGTTLTASLSPAVVGMSVTLSSNTISSGSIATTATLHYTATENAKGETTLILSDGTTTKDVKISYTAKVTDWTLQSVSTATTWNWSKLTANSDHTLYNKNGICLTSTSDPDYNTEFVLANYAEGDLYTIADEFDGTTMAFKGEYPIRYNDRCQNGTLRFKTTVPGTIVVKFNDTGSSASATAVKRYLQVNGVNTEYWTSRQNNSSDPNVAYDSQMDVVSGEIAVPAGDVTISGSSAIQVYYVTFTPTSADNVTANVASSGYTTYASVYPLDFANAVETGSNNKTLKAYVVSEVSKTAVTLTEVTSVPANTGVVLKGTPSTTYSIPVIASADPVGTNLLTPVVYKTTVEANSVYVVSGGLFCLFEGTSIPAGKAYLAKSLVPQDASMLDFDFGGATGIDDVKSQMEDVRGDFYNLSGQRVAQPTKGLYIVNGKKVIIK